jgi:hypothetical protein
LVSDIKGRTKTEDVREQGAEEDIWTKDGSSDRRVDKTAQRRASYFVLFNKYNYNNQVEEDEISGACSTNGEKGKAYRLLVGKREEDQDVGGWIILGWISERWGGVMWTGLVSLRIRTGGELL